tara:strand:+ start:981 stop:1499 length:519 start_codon:yes stop_codon:yes gene_type:complete
MSSLVLISREIIVDSALVPITGIDDTFSTYYLRCSHVGTSSNNGINIRVTSSGTGVSSSVYDSAGYNIQSSGKTNRGGTGNSQFQLFNNVSSNNFYSHGLNNWWIKATHMSDSSHYSYLLAYGQSETNAGNIWNMPQNGCVVKQAAAHDGFLVQGNGGANIPMGTFSLYGES